MSNYIINTSAPVIQNRYQSNKILNFHSSDREFEFPINKEKMGEDWYYYDKEIEYKFNSWGYRSKEFTDLSDDYILVFGCSCTEGIGLHFDDMWSTKLGKKLNLDVFNLGMGASGVDYQFHNTIMFHNFLLKTRKFPKLVVYQWPSDYRTSAMFLNKQSKTKELDVEFFSPHYRKIDDRDDMNSFFDWYMHGFVDNKGELTKQNGLYPMISNNLWKSLNIPVLNWTFGVDFVPDEQKIFGNEYIIHSVFDLTGVLARDLGHNGHLSQDLVVDLVIDKLKYEDDFSK